MYRSTTLFTSCSFVCSSCCSTSPIRKIMATNNNKIELSRRKGGREKGWSHSQSKGVDLLFMQKRTSIRFAYKTRWAGLNERTGERSPLQPSPFIAINFRFASFIFISAEFADVLCQTRNGTGQAQLICICALHTHTTRPSILCSLASALWRSQTEKFNKNRIKLELNADLSYLFIRHLRRHIGCPGVYLYTCIYGMLICFAQHQPESIGWEDTHVAGEWDNYSRVFGGSEVLTHFLGLRWRLITELHSTQSSRWSVDISLSLGPFYFN